MKKTTIGLSIIIGVFTANTIMAGEICATKAASIQKQIDHAKRYNNIHRVAGLQKALSDVNTYCDDGQEYRNAVDKVKKAEREVADARQDIIERQADIREAQTKGDQKKVRKLQSKLTSEQRKLQDKQATLDALRTEQNRMAQSSR